MSFSKLFYFNLYFYKYTEGLSLISLHYQFMFNIIGSLTKLLLLARQKRREEDAVAIENIKNYHSIKFLI